MIVNNSRFFHFHAMIISFAEYVHLLCFNTTLSCTSLFFIFFFFFAILNVSHIHISFDFRRLLCCVLETIYGFQFYDYGGNVEAQLSPKLKKLNTRWFCQCLLCSTLVNKQKTSLFLSFIIRYKP